MAERYTGKVVQIHTDGSDCRSKELLLGHLLDAMTGLNAHYYDPESKTLTAYIQDDCIDESALIRALVTAGMRPVRVSDVGADNKDDRHAC